jgi:ubiquinone/menaquinone biosynthesis C-methylase UbiE
VGTPSGLEAELNRPAIPEWWHPYSSHRIEDPPLARRYGLHARFIAWAMAREGIRYSGFVQDRKQRLFDGLTGTLLEIGAGTGINLRFLPPEVRFVALEPNPFMHPYLLARARELERPLTLVQGTAEALPFPDESLDGVLSTLVLCSVKELDRVLGEVARVLKPGGRFLFLEHVGAPEGSRLLRIQRWLRPAWRKLGDGCLLDRDTEAYLSEAGFRNLEVERFSAPVLLVSPHITGVAYK